MSKWTHHPTTFGLTHVSWLFSVPGAFAQDGTVGGETGTGRGSAAQQGGPDHESRGWNAVDEWGLDSWEVVTGPDSDDGKCGKRRKEVPSGDESVESDEYDDDDSFAV